MKRYAAQIDLSWKILGLTTHFLPVAISNWLHERNIHYCYVGHSTSGNIKDGHSHYNLSNGDKEDYMIFKLMFPGCRVNVFQYHD